MAEIDFFGDIDKTAAGSNAGERPAWFFDVHLEKMEESVSKKRRQLEQNRIPQENIFMVRNEIEAEEKKIARIKSSKPKLKGAQKDSVHKEYQSLRQQLSDSMPTHMENQKGFTKPREELKRLNERHVTISPEMAKACGVEAYRGKITGKQAEKCFSIMGKSLGENTNIERIRRDGKSESYRTIDDHTAMIIKKFAQEVKAG